MDHNILWLLFLHYPLLSLKLCIIFDNLDEIKKKYLPCIWNRLGSYNGSKVKEKESAHRQKIFLGCNTHYTYFVIQCFYSINHWRSIYKNFEGHSEEYYCINHIFFVLLHKKKSSLSRKATIKKIIKSLLRKTKRTT